MHCYVIGKGFGVDVHVGNALIDMYLKCMDVESAQKFFYRMSEGNTVSWNSILSEFVYNEQFLDALVLFNPNGRKLKYVGSHIGVC